MMNGDFVVFNLFSLAYEYQIVVETHRGVSQW